jgi:hypothetical protein
MFKEGDRIWYATSSLGFKLSPPTLREAVVTEVGGIGLHCSHVQGPGHAQLPYSLFGETWWADDGRALEGLQKLTFSQINHGLIYTRGQYLEAQHRMAVYQETYCRGDPKVRPVVGDTLWVVEAQQPAVLLNVPDSSPGGSTPVMRPVHAAREVTVIARAAEAERFTVEDDRPRGSELQDADYRCAWWLTSADAEKAARALDHRLLWSGFEWALGRLLSRLRPVSTREIPKLDEVRSPVVVLFDLLRRQQAEDPAVLAGHSIIATVLRSLTKEAP